MAASALDPIETARLLRELADEVVAAEGAARNGLFLELHRLHDTLFRRALAEHPAAPPELAAQAYQVVDALPAPQVVRELHGLGSELVQPEIRRLYKHMNVARNNMAHEPVLARVVVSRSNAKRMARLARLVADQLDPHRIGLPAAGEGPPPPRPAWPRQTLYLVVGGGAGFAAGWMVWARPSFAFTVVVATIMSTIVVALFVLDDS